MRAFLPVLIALGMFLVDTPTTTEAADSLPTVITVGTSIEAGVGQADGESWPQRLAQRAPNLSFTDMSLGGGAYTADNSLGDNTRKHVDAAIALHPDLIILGGPVNDLVQMADVGPLREAVYEAVDAARAQGIRVLVMAIFPFDDGGALAAGWWPNLEQRRSTYNTWCAEMYGPDCVGIDWALHETTSWRADGRWFHDGLHFTRVGAALVAEAFPLDRLELS